MDHINFEAKKGEIFGFLAQTELKKPPQYECSQASPFPAKEQPKSWVLTSNITFLSVHSDTGDPHTAQTELVL